MNESQRDWTIQAAYSDYQALAKLLSLFPGRTIVLVHYSGNYTIGNYSNAGTVMRSRQIKKQK